MNRYRLDSPRLATFVAATSLLIAPLLFAQPIELVKDLNAGGNGSYPFNMTNVNGLVFFWAIDGAVGTGYSLYKTNGTASGTVYVDDLDDPDISLNYQEPTEAGGKLYFRANTNTQPDVDAELWVSDGHTIELARDIHPTGNGSVPQFLTELGNDVTFIALEPSLGWELWKSDGTPGGTLNVDDIHAGGSSAYDPNIGFSRTVVREGAADILYFLAYSPRADPFDPETTGGFELWRSDGTAAGTDLVVDMFLGGQGSVPNSSIPFHITPVGDDLLFSCHTPGAGRELCRWDGATGTVAADIDAGPHPDNSNPYGFVAVGDRLYFLADDGSTGFELWTWTAAAGASLVGDLTPGPGSSDITEMTVFGGQLFFVFDNGDAANGREPWKSDGTFAGTALLKDVATGLDAFNRANDSNPAELTVSGGMLYFAAWTPEHGRELWRSDGTTIGTELVEDLWPGTGGSDPTWLADGEGTLYFAATDQSLWRELFRVGPPALIFVDGFESGDLTSW